MCKIKKLTHYILSDVRFLYSRYSYKMAAASKTLAKALNDIAECPICMEVFSDPRVLPCVHTYCLKCIEKHIDSESISTDKPTCPLCRTEFTLPKGGVQSLPRNFYMDRFQNIRGLSSETNEEVPCEACSAQSDTDVDKKKMAKMYCIDCEQRLCESLFAMRTTSQKPLLNLRSLIKKTLTTSAAPGF